jgi:hypothetical protein
MFFLWLVIQPGSFQGFGINKLSILQIASQVCVEGCEGGRFQNTGLNLKILKSLKVYVYIRSYHQDNLGAFQIIKYG